MALMSSSRTCANNPYTSAATPQIKDTTLINCDTIVENMQFKQNLDRLYLDCGQLCQSDKTCTNCCKDNVHSDAFGKIIMLIFCRFHDPVKSLHFETIAWQSKELQKHYRFYAILPLWKGNTAGDAFLQYNHKNRITVCQCTCNSRHHTMPSSDVQRQRAQLGASET